jgi:hypothetical protein
MLNQTLRLELCSAVCHDRIGLVVFRIKTLLSVENKVRREMNEVGEWGESGAHVKQIAGPLNVDSAGVGGVPLAIRRLRHGAAVDNVTWPTMLKELQAILPDGEIEMF